MKQSQCGEREETVNLEFSICILKLPTLLGKGIYKIKKNVSPQVPLGCDHFSNFPSFDVLDSFEEYYW